MKKTLLFTIALFVTSICFGQNDSTNVKLSLYNYNYNNQKEIGTNIRAGANTLGAGTIIFMIGTIIKLSNESKEITATRPDDIKAEAELIKRINTLSGVVQIVGVGVMALSTCKFAKAGKLMINQKSSNSSYIKPAENGVGLSYVF